MKASSFLRSSEEIQRASWNSETSNSTGSEYSASRRALSTSSCSGPTTPTSAGAPQLGLHAAAEFAGAQPCERDAVAVVRIHIGLDLEHEGAHARLRCLDLAQIAFLRPRLRREAPKALQQIADAEIAQRAAEID